jgi:hypothetical protein
MKTDLVLTMGEYLAMCCDVSKHVSPPARGAHHIPITADGDIGPKNGAQACRCDRWGHPCAGCTDDKQGQRAAVQDFTNREQNGIPDCNWRCRGDGTYAVIIVGCLKQPEW